VQTQLVLEVMVHLRCASYTSVLSNAHE